MNSPWPTHIQLANDVMAASISYGSAPDDDLGISERSSLDMSAFNFGSGRSQVPMVPFNVPTATAYGVVETVRSISDVYVTYKKVEALALCVKRDSERNEKIVEMQRMKYEDIEKDRQRSIKEKELANQENANRRDAEIKVLEIQAKSEQQTMELNAKEKEAEHKRRKELLEFAQKTKETELQWQYDNMEKQRKHDLELLKIKLKHKGKLAKKTGLPAQHSDSSDSSDSSQ